MKKILILLCLITICSTSVCANEAKSNVFSKLFKKKEVVSVQEATSTSDEMTKSEKAVLYYSDNELQKSFDTLISIPEKDRSAQDWVLLGNLLQDQEKTSDAIFMYKRAIIINPNNYKAYFNLGNIYLEDEKPYLAIENYRKANKLKNDFPYAYYNLGCAYLQLGDFKKAKIAFLKAIEIKNTEPDFHYNLAYTYKKLGKEKLSKQYLGFYNKLMENQ